jgi:hypothetical protein
MTKKLLLVPALILAAGLALTGCTAPTETEMAPTAPAETVAPNPAEGLDLPVEVPLITENILPETYEKTDIGYTVLFKGDIADVPERVLSAMETDGWEVSADPKTAVAGLEEVGYVVPTEGEVHYAENENYRVAFYPVTGDPSGAGYTAVIVKR